MCVSLFDSLDHDRARKHGLEDLIQADPSFFNHHVLFEKLQLLTLTHRLNDSYSCLVWNLQDFFCKFSFLASLLQVAREKSVSCIISRRIFLLDHDWFKGVT